MKCDVGFRSMQVPHRDDPQEADQSQAELIQNWQFTRACSLIRIKQKTYIQAWPELVFGQCRSPTGMIRHRRINPKADLIQNQLILLCAKKIYRSIANAAKRAPFTPLFLTYTLIPILSS